MRSLQPHDLGGGEAVAGHRAARALDLEHDLVLVGPRDGEHGVDLGGEPPHRPGPQVAFEVENEDALLGGPRARLLRRFEELAAQLGGGLQRLLVEQPGVDRVGHRVIALVERTDGQTRLGRIAAAPRPRDDQRDDRDQCAGCDNDQQGLQSEVGDVEPERHRCGPPAQSPRTRGRG